MLESINGWTDKQIVVHLYNRELPSNKNEWIIDAQKNMD